MKREIKFRAWDKEKNQFYKPTYNASEGELEELLLQPDGSLLMRTMRDHMKHESTFLDRFVVQSFTGLKDKNGKEIYEGDILMLLDQGIVTLNAPSLGVYRKVLFDEENASFVAAYTDGNTRVSGYTFCKNNSNKFEIIGNIYQESELLEEK